MKKMKVFALVLSILVLITAVSGCGSEQAEENPVGDTSDTTTTPSDTEPTENLDQPAEDYGNLTVDLSVKGEIKGGYSIDSTGFLLNGVEYKMPFLFSQLLDNGWTSNGTDIMAKARCSVSLISVDGRDKDGTNRFGVMRVLNSADVEKPLSDCYVTAMDFSDYEQPEITLPGGICMNSTAADVMATYGSAENNPYFENVNVSETGITYTEHKDSGVSYRFSFRDDGGISYLRMELSTEDALLGN